MTKNNIYGIIFIESEREVINMNYKYEELEFWVKELSSYELTEKEIWDRVYNETDNEDLATDVLETLMKGEY